MRDIINFLLGMGCIFLIGASFSAFEYRNRMKELKRRILNDYGKKINIEDVRYKMVSASSYFENKKIKTCIDDITWNDLSMDEIYKTINNTQSSAGRDVLYYMLRCPLYNKEDLIKRDSIIEYFRNNQDKRREIQYILGKLGESKDLYTTNCLFNEIDNTKSKLLKYNILSALPLVALILSFFNGYFLILLIASIGVNIWISYSDKQLNYNIDGFSYIISVVKYASKIKELNIKELNDNLEDISSSLKKVKSIKNKSLEKSNTMISSDINVFSEYTKMITLNELINYEKVKNTVMKNSKEFNDLYEYLGTIDALIGVASFRDSLNYYTKPELSKSVLKRDNKIEFEDLYHPLIKNPVSNSGNFNKCILLTGSNASGKSTFIKAVAINQLLSQTIYTTCANSYKAPFFNIYTSMALKDDIFSSESYYIVEIKSLKRIIDSVNNDIPCLCFVDEILRGTNTIERIASSTEVLSHLSDSNTVCFAATHDIELTHLLEGKFDNYHFEETITDKDIEFDYKLHKGRAQTRNAIKLLDFMGYDKEIVEKSDNRAKKFLKTGSW